MNYFTGVIGTFLDFGRKVILKPKVLIDNKIMIYYLLSMFIIVRIGDILMISISRT